MLIGASSRIRCGVVRSWDGRRCRCGRLRRLAVVRWVGRRMLVLKVIIIGPVGLWLMVAVLILLLMFRLVRLLVVVNRS